MSESAAGVTSVSSGRARLRAFAALCRARFLEFYRESEVIFWSFVFPILLAVGLGIAFRNRPADVLPVAVVAGPQADAVATALGSSPLLHVAVMPEAAAARALRRGKVTLTVVPAAAGGPVAYRFDPARSESELARSRVDDLLQRAAGRSDPLAAQDQRVSEPGARYIDFLIPGIIGMNLLSGGMWGVGFSLVDMRIKKLLKRLTATPMYRSDFMLAVMMMRVGFMFIEVSFMLAFGHLAFGVPLRGSLAGVYALGAMGSLCFGGIGLLLAARSTRIESVMGLMNLVSMPMFIVSGVFFSAERFPDALQPLIRALPLTAFIDALRALLLEGASLASQAGRLGVLAAWGLVSFVVGLRLFRWS
jgi:ABC-2 type transport system permease protein